MWNINIYTYVSLYIYIYRGYGFKKNLYLSQKKPFAYMDGYVSKKTFICLKKNLYVYSR